jgi:tellurite resistance protein TehA-like permease
VTYLVILILYKLVITTLLGLWKTIDDYYISLGMAVTTISIMTFISAILTAYTVLIMPIMSVTGVKLKYAFSQSIRKTSDMIIPIFLGLWIPVIAKSLIGSAIAVIGLKHLLLCMDILLNTCLFSYLVVYIMIVYYEIEQIKREDYTPHYYVKKSRKGISKD